MHTHRVACHLFALAHFEGVWTLDECRGLASLMHDATGAPPRAYVRVLRARGGIDALRIAARRRAVRQTMDLALAMLNWEQKNGREPRAEALKKKDTRRSHMRKAS